LQNELEDPSDRPPCPPLPRCWRGRRSERPAFGGSREQARFGHTAVLVYFNAHRKDPQAHGYRCSFHPEVLNIVSIGKRVSATKSMLNPWEASRTKMVGT
jgi:hypothetical protein